jgi:hypothetical protein
LRKICRRPLPSQSSIFSHLAGHVWAEAELVADLFKFFSRQSMLLSFVCACMYVLHIYELFSRCNTFHETICIFPAESE